MDALSVSVGLLMDTNITALPPLRCAKDGAFGCYTPGATFRGSDETTFLCRQHLLNRKNLPTSHIDSIKPRGTTYIVPRIRRGKRCPKISHIAQTCKTKHEAQKIQKCRNLRIFRPNIRAPRNATKVHIIAACHLCGGLPLSRIMEEASTSARPTHIKTLSLAPIGFSFLIVVA